MVSPETKYWQESGWTQETTEGATIYRGFYSVTQAGQSLKFPGTIVERITPAVDLGD